MTFIKKIIIILSVAFISIFLAKITKDIPALGSPWVWGWIGGIVASVLTNDNY